MRPSNMILAKKNIKLENIILQLPDYGYNSPLKLTLNLPRVSQFTPNTQSSAVGYHLPVVLQ